MRKASREMDAAFALEVLDKAPYVTVSMTIALHTVPQYSCRLLPNARLRLARKTGALRYSTDRQLPSVRQRL